MGEGDSEEGPGLRSLSDVYRFLLKPGWILSHIFVLACVVVFVNLGIWQLRRLDERKTYNAEVAAAEALPPEFLADLLPEGAASTTEQVDAVLYRSVQVTGTYSVDQQVLVQNRSNGGAPGYWVLTPLVQADGTAVVVNRGWIPFSYTVDGPWTDFDPPAGTVSVLGMVRAPQVRPTSGLVTGPHDAPDGVLRALARVDVPRLQQQVTETLLPIYVDLQVQEPAQPGPLPEPIPEPELSEGPHLELRRPVVHLRPADDHRVPAAAAPGRPPPARRRPRCEQRCRRADRSAGRLGAAPEGDGGPPPVTVPPSS